MVIALKRIFSLALAALLSFLLFGCTERPSKYVPCNQPYTKWETADKSVTMYISDDEYGYGYLKSADDTIQVYFEFYLDVLYCGKYRRKISAFKGHS